MARGHDRRGTKKQCQRNQTIIAGRYSFSSDNSKCFACSGLAESSATLRIASVSGMGLNRRLGRHAQRAALLGPWVLASAT